MSLFKVTVHNQAELDAALAEHASNPEARIYLDSPAIPHDKESIRKRLEKVASPAEQLKLNLTEPNACIIRIVGESEVSLGGKTHIDKVCDNAKLEWPSGEATIRTVSGNARISVMKDKVHIDTVRDSVRISIVSGEAVIDFASGNCEIGQVTTKATIKQLSENAFVDTLQDNAEISVMQGNSRVLGVRGAARIGKITGHALIERVTGTAEIKALTETGKINVAEGASRIRLLSDNANISTLREGAVVNAVNGYATIGTASDRAFIGQLKHCAQISRVEGNAEVNDASGSSYIGQLANSARVSNLLHGGRVENASGTTVIHLYQGGYVQHTEGAAVVFRHVSNAAAVGEHVIDTNESDIRSWAKLHGAEITADDNLILYKAVDEDYMSGLDFRPTEYPIGATVTATDWQPDGRCGHGLLSCATPEQAQRWNPNAWRILRVSAPIDSVQPIVEPGIPKVKAPEFYVVDELPLPLPRTVSPKAVFRKLPDGRYQCANCGKEGFGWISRMGHDAWHRDHAGIPISAIKKIF